MNPSILSIPSIRPFGDCVLVRRDPAEEKTSGGILIPKNAEKESSMGRVIAAGPGKVTDEGVTLPLGVKVGDHVVFQKYGPAEVVLNGESLLILRDSDILAVVEDETQA